MAVITISRQYGSGGDEIARQLCELLAYGYFDKLLLNYTAAKVGLSASEIVDFSENNYNVRSLIDHLIVGWRSPHTIAQTEIWQKELFGEPTLALSSLNEMQSQALVEYALQAAYRHDNMVIVGRGGQIVLKDQPDVLHVRIQAPMAIRIERLQARQQISAGLAQSRLSEYDRASAGYLKHFYEVDWSDPLLYHLMINTGHLEFEAAARLIINALDHLSANPSSK